MYYSPGVFPNYHVLGTKERDIPEQQLEPIEDYSEMTEEEIQSKVDLLLEEASEYQINKILQRAVESSSAFMWSDLPDWILEDAIKSLIEDGEL